MMKRIVSVLLALMMIAAPAMAEVFTGTTIARSTQAITADAGGILDELCIRPGSIVKEGETIARLRTTKVFAAQNGTVARIHAQEGREAEGTVLEIAPVSRYTIHCTSGEAYDSISSNLVHCGEILYMKCTNNGTHQGRGRVYSIDGETYMLEATAGEFYVGETVYLYRDPEYAYKKLVGVGTVVSSAAEAYESKGRIAAIHVAEGEYVEKGELLYEVIDGESAEILAPADGIITACHAENGSAVEEGQVIAEYVRSSDLLISVPVDEYSIAGISVGDDASVVYASDADEQRIAGKVIDISYLAEDESYTVLVQPEILLPYLGMHASVYID